MLYHNPQGCLLQSFVMTWMLSLKMSGIAMVIGFEIPQPLSPTAQGTQGTSHLVAANIRLYAIRQITVCMQLCYVSFERVIILPAAGKFFLSMPAVEERELAQLNCQSTAASWLADVFCLVCIYTICHQAKSTWECIWILSQMYRCQGENILPEMYSWKSDRDPWQWFICQIPQGTDRSFLDFDPIGCCP